MEESGALIGGGLGLLRRTIIMDKINKIITTILKTDIDNNTSKYIIGWCTILLIVSIIL